jgi:diguanylate cyclase (GGDEF)-like protein
MSEPIRVLVVDDERVDRIAVRRYLASVSDPLFTVEEAVDGASALAAVERGDFHCVLLDLHLPDLTGLDWLRQFPVARARPPVVLLTALEDERVAVAALQEGAQDYLVKDQLTAGLLARSIRYAVERGRGQRALEEARRQMEQVAFLDPLTGLLNRRGLEHILRGDLARAAREGTTLAGLFIDCDDFKSVNTVHGHATGDAILQAVATRIESLVRTSDRTARVGADEFLVVLPDGPQADIAGFAERLRRAIASTPIVVGDAAISQRVSVGMFAVPPEAQSVTDLLAVGSRVEKGRASSDPGSRAATRHERFEPMTPTVLLVDDDQIDALAMSKAFRANNLPNPIVRAKDGVEALAVLRGEGRAALSRPYVVLLDLNMPRMNGIEFLEELRADQRLRDSVVFVLTTSAAEEDRAAAYHKNVAGYILKSDAGQDFVELVQLLQQYWRIVELPSGHS